MPTVKHSQSFARTRTCHDTFGAVVTHSPILSSATFRHVSHHLIRADPVPVWYIEEGHKPDFNDGPIWDLHRKLQPVGGRAWIAFRGVPLDRLRAVLDNGVDVDPTDTTIFCADDESKAFEYARPRSGGDGAGLMYAMHGAYLERSFRMLPADASAEAIAKVRQVLPPSVR